MRVKQGLMGLVVLGVVAAFIVSPLIATDYTYREGVFQARILSSASGMGMAARPVIRARVQDETGRVFWIVMSNTVTTAPGTELLIEIWCETESLENCIGRYAGLAAP